MPAKQLVFHDTAPIASLIPSTDCLMVLNFQWISGDASLASVGETPVL